MHTKKQLINFKILSAVLFIFVTILTGCNSVESNSTRANNSNKQVTSSPTPAPSQSGDPTDAARRITIDEARAAWEKNKDSIIFVDTRTADAYKASHIKGAILLNDFLNRSGVPKDRMIITYCT